MRTQIFIFTFICCMAVACSPAKKSQSLRSSESSASSASYELLDDNTFQLSSISTDPTYGYSEKNAIRVGNGGPTGGPLNERRFLNALLGPNGETVTYERRGSCCAVPSKNGFMGHAMLDRYVVKYEGIDKPVVLFINMYDPGELVAPKGFRFKK